jgi:hypothetical protein
MVVKYFCHVFSIKGCKYNCGLSHSDVRCGPAHLTHFGCAVCGLSHSDVRCGPVHLTHFGCAVCGLSHSDVRCGPVHLTHFGALLQ